MNTVVYEETAPAEATWVYPGGYTEPYCDVVLQLAFDNTGASDAYTNYSVSVFYLPRRNETRAPAIWDTEFKLDNAILPDSPTQIRFPTSDSQTLVAGERVLWCIPISFKLKNDGTQHKLSFNGVCKTTAPRFFPNYPLSITFTTPKQVIIPGIPEEYHVTYDAEAPKLTYRWSEATNAVRYTLTRWFYYRNVEVEVGPFISTNSGTSSLTYEEIAAGQVCETDPALFNNLTRVKYRVRAYSQTGTVAVSEFHYYTIPSGVRKVFVKVNGVWRRAIPWVKVNGIWKRAKAWVKVNGAWKSTIS